jgi:hypothetical protein
MHEVADYIDPANPHNDRLLETDYVKVNEIDGVKNNLPELQRRISPTGALRCSQTNPGSIHDAPLSANVVFPKGVEGDSNIIISDLHALFKKGTCEQIYIQ